MFSRQREWNEMKNVLLEKKWNKLLWKIFLKKYLLNLREMEKKKEEK